MIHTPRTNKAPIFLSVRRQYPPYPPGGLYPFLTLPRQAALLPGFPPPRSSLFGVKWVSMLPSCIPGTDEWLRRAATSSHVSLLVSTGSLSYLSRMVPSTTQDRPKFHPTTSLSGLLCQEQIGQDLPREREHLAIERMQQRSLFLPNIVGTLYITLTMYVKHDHFVNHDGLAESAR